MLYDYFRESRYSILLDFASVIYTKKLELSLDRKHATQQLKLVSLDGAPVPVTFRLSNNGEVRIGFRILRRALMRRGSCAACTSVPHGARSATHDVHVAGVAHRPGARQVGDQHVESSTVADRTGPTADYRAAAGSASH